MPTFLINVKGNTNIDWGLYLGATLGTALFIFSRILALSNANPLLVRHTISIMSGKRAYRQANLDWLSAKAREIDVHEIVPGVYYRALTSAEDSSKKPTESSIIQAHYTGRTIDGRIFDSSVGSNPLVIRLRQLIPGWIIAMKQMSPGDKWEIYMNADMGYGKLAQTGIPAHSTLIFEVDFLHFT